MITMDISKHQDKFVIISAIIASFVFIYLSTIYLPLSYQFIVGWCLLIPLFILKKKNFISKKIPVRIVFLLIAAFLSMRYFYWRSTETLFYIGLFDFIGVILLFVAEAYSIIVHLIGMFVNLWPVNRKPVPLPTDTNSLPSVDIFIPTYSESEEIVRITTIACNHINYPKDKINIYILDDGGTTARRNSPKTSESAWKRYKNFKIMAEELGVDYIAREKNEHAKAGNVNNALKYSDGDLVLILDCDHVPTKDILQNTVGLFIKDEKMFLVQTPHFLINPGPIEKNLGTFSDAPTENEMFYGSIQLGLDFWNSAFFCGSAALLRRKYLEEAGGISGDTITEDAETALTLHAKGYNSAYISQPMVCGLSPETFDDFILQRSRWAQGMTQIFILKNPLLIKGLSLYQRICYTNSCLFWFFGLTRIVFYLSPLAFLFFGLKIYNASVSQVLAYAVPHVVGAFIVSDYLYGKVRWSLFSELYESVQSIFILPAVISVLLNPRAPTFKVTPKGKSLKNNFLSPLAAPFYVIFFLILISFPIAGVRWFTDAGNRDIVAICGIWSIYNLVLILACLGVVWERRFTRRHHRLALNEKADVYFPDINITQKCIINDLSLGGAGIDLSDISPDILLKQGDELVLKSIDSSGELYELKGNLAWVREKKGKKQIGVEYKMLQDEETFSRSVEFFYGDSERWAAFRDDKFQGVGFWKGLSYLTKKGIIGGYSNIRGLIESNFMPKINLKTRLKKIINEI